MKSFFNFLYLKKSNLIAVLFLVLIFFLSFLVPFLSPYSDDIHGAVFFENKNHLPSISHWFGTDSAGRDVFTLTVYGAMSSFKVAFGVVFLSVLIGVPVGLIAGASSGSKTDEALMRITDGFLAFPPIVLPIIITTVLGPSLNNVIIGIAISWFPWYARISRSQAIIIKSSDYVMISKSLGASKFHIIKNHIFPNIVNSLFIQGSIDAGYAILTAAGLSFIGLGVQPPDVEWGLLINTARSQFLNNWWVMFFPGLFLVLSVVSFNIIGDGLREYYNRKWDRI
ncbi:MAG: D-ala-D-ala transporter subunit [Candidatus Marinimicrobia bacterium]|nr:D-ala-D-ala transporter subunit [Candidatus Neomarinimicrobiota bacterium]